MLLHKSIAVCAIVAGLAGCAGTPTAPNIAQVQQVITSFCPLVNADLTVLSTSPAIAPPLQAQFKTILAVNKQACSVGGGVTITDLQTLNTQVVQAAIGLLFANPEIPNQPQILLALQLGEPIVNQAITQLQAQKASASTGSTPTK